MAATPRPSHSPAPPPLSPSPPTTITTRSDLWVLGSYVAVRHMGGPHIPFTAGRRDAEDGKACPPEERLPVWTETETSLRVQFARMGMTARDLVALMGAHTVGHTYPENRLLVEGLAVVGGGGGGRRRASAVAAIVAALSIHGSCSHHLTQLPLLLFRLPRALPTRVDALRTRTPHACRHSSGFPYKQWDNTPRLFDNAYYRLLLNSGWQYDELGEGKDKKEFYFNRSWIMLLTDYMLRTDPDFSAIAREYANDEQAWFVDFADAFRRLTERGLVDRCPAKLDPAVGCPFAGGGGRRAAAGEALPPKHPPVIGVM
jgi:hypothetical protein